MIKAAGAGMVMLVGVQSNQFPRALDIARPLARAGHPGRRSAASTSRACCRCSTATIADLDRAKAIGALAVRRRGGRPARRGAARRGGRHAQAALQLHERSAGHRGHADPADGGRARAAHRRRHRPASMPAAAARTSARSAPSSTCRAANRAGARPTTSSRSCGSTIAQGSAQLLHHRRQFRPQQGLGGDPRSADPAARRWRSSIISFIIQVDTLCHKLPNFIEKCARAGVQARVHRAGEHQPGQSAGRQEAAEQDHRISQDAARLEEGAA